MRKLALFALLAFALAAPSARAADVAVPHSGWYWGNPLPQGNTLHALAFAGGAGYAAGDLGTLLKSSDGGLSWRAPRSRVRAHLGRVQALDAGKLFVAGACVMRRSDDGGQTFARVPATSGERSCKSGVAAFHFLDGSTGLVVLSNGRVRRTGNGGHSFSDRGPIPGTSAAGAADPKTPADAWLLSSQT